MIWFWLTLYLTTALIIFTLVAMNAQTSVLSAFAYAVTWPLWSTGLIAYLYAMTTYDRFKTIFGKKDKA